MSENAPRDSQPLSATLWELRMEIEGELRELTEAQQQMDVLKGSPSERTQDTAQRDVHARLAALIRTNERVLELLYEAIRKSDRLRQAT
jgi:hypothetical protein